MPVLGGLEVEMPRFTEIQRFRHGPEARVTGSVLEVERHYKNASLVCANSERGGGAEQTDDSKRNLKHHQVHLPFLQRRRCPNIAFAPQRCRRNREPNASG